VFVVCVGCGVWLLVCGVSLIATTASPDNTLPLETGPASANRCLVVGCVEEDVVAVVDSGEERLNTSRMKVITLSFRRDLECAVKSTILPSHEKQRWEFTCGSMSPLSSSLRSASRRHSR